jgi:hypothetical protein
MTVLHVAIFSKPFLPVLTTETDAESLTRCGCRSCAFYKTENDYEEGLFRGAHFFTNFDLVRSSQIRT